MFFVLILLLPVVKRRVFVDPNLHLFSLIFCDHLFSDFEEAIDRGQPADSLKNHEYPFLTPHDISDRDHAISVDVVLGGLGCIFSILIPFEPLLDGAIVLDFVGDDLMKIEDSADAGEVLVCPGAVAFERSFELLRRDEHVMLSGLLFGC